MTTQKQHEESGCTDYLQHNTNSCPHLVRQPHKPLFACLECGKKFYTTASAERAAFGDNGCPKCGGSDIDVYLDRSAQ